MTNEWWCLKTSSYARLKQSYNDADGSFCVCIRALQVKARPLNGVHRARSQLDTKALGIEGYAPDKPYETGCCNSTSSFILNSYQLLKRR